MTHLTRAQRAIKALREPDYTMARVPNTVRQSIAEVIETQERAILMTRETAKTLVSGLIHDGLDVERLTPAGRAEIKKALNLILELTT